MQQSFPLLLNNLQLHGRAAGNASPGFQSAAPQPSTDQKPKSDSLTLRRRQSFNYGDNRMGPLVPSEAGSAPSGRPPEAPTTQKALPATKPASAAALPAPKAASQRRAVGGPPSLRANPKLPQPTGEPELQAPSAVQKKVTTGNGGGLPRLPVKAHVKAAGKPAETKPLREAGSVKEPAQVIKPPPGPPSGPRAAVAGESVQVKRRGASPAELVEKYKRDSAARKQRQSEVTLERISSLAAGLQHAASGSLTATNARASSYANKQSSDGIPVAAVATPSSSQGALVRGKAAMDLRHPAAKPVQKVQPKADRDKTEEGMARARQHDTHGAATPVPALYDDTQSSSQTELP